MSGQRRQGRRHQAAPTTNTERETMGKPKAKPVTEAATAAELGDGLTAVRTTFNPREVIRVGAAELLDLKRQGLIFEPNDDVDDEVPPAGADSPDAVDTAAPATGADDKEGGAA